MFDVDLKFKWRKPHGEIKQSSGSSLQLSAIAIKWQFLTTVCFFQAHCNRQWLYFLSKRSDIDDRECDLAFAWLLCVILHDTDGHPARMWCSLTHKTEQIVFGNRYPSTQSGPMCWEKVINPFLWRRSLFSFDGKRLKRQPLAWPINEMRKQMIWTTTQGPDERRQGQWSRIRSPKLLWLDWMGRRES